MTSEVPLKRARSTTVLRPVPAQSRRQHVVEILREAIMSGQLVSGSRLTEMDLSEQLGTSRAPIREALRQLEQEGLVASSPYRGTEVIGVSQEEIEQVLVPVRIALECFAFTKAGPRLAADDFAALESLVRDMAAAARDHDSDRLAQADISFHEAVMVASQQRHCLQMWRTIQPRVQAYFRRDASSYAGARVVAEQHQQLVDVLRGGDIAKITAAVEEHIHIHSSTDTPKLKAAKQ